MFNDLDNSKKDNSANNSNNNPPDNQAQALGNQPAQPDNNQSAQPRANQGQAQPEPTRQGPNNLPVDDIFAETDKTPEQPAYSRGGKNGVEIEAKKVGLISEKERLESEVGEKTAKKGIFKILIIIILVIIVALGGYLVYNKFFSSSPTLEENLNTNQPAANQEQEGTPFEQVEQEPTEPEPPVAQEPAEPQEPEETATGTEPIEPVFVPVVDSDDDGLTDDEEIIAGTNINIIDTDNDGLSDYEELKIYGSNPLNADSDADGYQDGEEVRNGYNPNGEGKLPGNIQ